MRATGLAGPAASPVAAAASAVSASSVACAVPAVTVAVLAVASRDDRRRGGLLVLSGAPEEVEETHGRTVSPG